MEVGESDAILGQLIQVWCPDLASIRSNVTVAEIVCDDDQKVGAFGGHDRYVCTPRQDVSVTDKQTSTRSCVSLLIWQSMAFYRAQNLWQQRPTDIRTPVFLVVTGGVTARRPRILGEFSPGALLFSIMLSARQQTSLAIAISSL